MKTLEERVEDLKSITKVQCAEGNFDHGEYMRGLANGLILALSVMEGSEPVFKEYPQDKDTLSRGEPQCAQ